jgi:acyl-CoA thioester hydrolase
MNVMWYVGKFDEANWNFLATLGLTPTNFAEQHRGMAAVQQNIAYKQELSAGNIVEVRSRALSLGDKSLRLLHEMWNAEIKELSASCELTVVHMDRRKRKALSFPEPVRVAVLAEITRWRDQASRATHSRSSAP